MTLPTRPDNDCGDLGKGYQPVPTPLPPAEPKPQGGYRPESGQGTNPADAPPEPD